jgi:hypothetical protein
LRCPDQGPIPRGRASVGHPPTRIGVFPFSGSPPREKKRRGSGERGAGAGRRGCTSAAVGAPRPGAAPVAARKEGASALEEEPDRSRDQGATVKAYAVPPSTPSWPRLHRRPDVSAAVAIFPSFLPLCMPPVLDRRRRGTPQRPLTCLCAGRRAAVLPPRDGSELLGTSCPRDRRRRAMNLCVRRPSCCACSVAEDVVRRCAASRRAPGFQVAAPSDRGEAAGALGTFVARARHRALKAGHWPAEPHGRPPRRAGVSGCLSFRACRRRVKQP